MMRLLSEGNKRGILHKSATKKKFTRGSDTLEHAMQLLEHATDENGERNGTFVEKVMRSRDRPKFGLGFGFGTERRLVWCFGDLSVSAESKLLTFGRLSA